MKIRISPEPTPQMIEAGINKLAKLRPGKPERQLKDIFQAMIMARPKTGRPRGSKDTKPRVNGRWKAKAEDTVLITPMPYRIRKAQSHASL
jgi:hypothetical protein